MTRFTAQVFWLGAIFSVISFSLDAFGQTFVPTETWIVGNGNYSTPGKWNPVNVPVASDSTLFPSGTSTVTFNVGGGSPPADAVYSVANLKVAFGGNVQFVSSAATGNVTSAVSNDAILSGALTLGNTTGNAVNLTVGDQLSVNTRATFSVQGGSDVTTDVLNFNSGTMTVTGSNGGSTLTVNYLNPGNTSLSNISTSIGNSTSVVPETATLYLQSSSIGNRINGALQIGNASSGTVWLIGASTLDLNGDPMLPPNHGIHDLFVGTKGVTGVNGELIVYDTGCSLTQFDGEAPSNITVGAATGGTGAIQIGGTLNTGTGLLTINRTGTVTITSGGGLNGILNANGDITVDGGSLYRTGVGTLNWAGNHTTTLIHGGTETIDANNSTYDTPLNSTYIINGFGSALKQPNTLSNSQLNINNGSVVHVSGAGSISSAAALNIGTNGTGALTVDGVGSSASASFEGGACSFGANGFIAQATFSNFATGSFTGGLYLTANSTFGTTGVVTVESGAVLSVDQVLAVGTSGGFTAGILTVTDQGSAVKLLGNLIVGHDSTGSGTIYVNNLGDLNADSTILRKTGTININGGSAELGTLTDSGGKINFISGSLSFNSPLTIGAGLLGSKVQLNSGSQLSTIGTGSGSGSTTINSNGILDVDGGSFTTSGLINSGVVTFNAGKFSVSFQLTNQASGVFIIAQNQVATFGSTTSTNAGEILLGGSAILSNISSLVNTGLIHGDGIIGANSLTNSAGGELRAENGSHLRFTSVNGTNAGKISLLGGTAEFTRALTNGATSGQILGHGTLIVGATGLTNNGSVAFSGGNSDVFGDIHNSTGTSARGIVISGNSSATFWDDVTNGVSAGDGTLFRVSGGSTATFFGSYSGNGISGTGTVFYESDISPGFSPALMTYGGNVVLDGPARLKMELGGTTAGTQADKVTVAGQLSLGGALNVVLINGFIPVQGNSFDLLDWGSLSGQFDSVSLPSLTSGLAWDATQLYTNGSLAVVSVGLLPGDFNRDGHVNAADIKIMEQALANRSSYEQSHGGLMDSQVTTLGDLNGDGQFTNADLQKFLKFLAMGGGSINTVPEPATCVLAMVGVACVWGMRISSRKSQH